MTYETELLEHQEDAIKQCDIPTSVVEQMRSYFINSPKPTTMEHGFILTKDFTIVPFENVSSTPLYEITISDQFMETYMKLLFSGKILAWVHSHPQWKALPSSTDILNHNAEINMIIYSVPEDVFMYYTPKMVGKLKLKLKEYSQWRTLTKSQ